MTESRRSRAALPARLGTLLAVFLAATACETAPLARLAGKVSKVEAQEARENLRRDIEDFRDFFELELDSASAEMAQAGRDSRSRADAARAKALILAALRSSADDAEPVEALLDTWAYCTRLRLYFESADAAQAFGAAVPPALDFARTCEERIARVADDNLPAADIPGIRKFVLAHAESHRMKDFLDDSAAHAEPVSFAKLRAVTDLVMLPLSPLMTFRKVNDTADAIGEFNRIADRFSGVVHDLPSDLRMETESVVQTTLADDRVTTVVLSLQRAAGAAEQLAAAASGWPERSGEAAKAVLDEVERASPHVLRLLEEARAAANELRATAEAADSTAGRTTELLAGVETASRSLEQAAIAVEEVIAGIDRLGEAPEGAAEKSEGRPFDPEDYRRAADSIRDGAREIRELLREVSQVQSPPLVAEIQDRGEAFRRRAAGDARDLVDHAFRRGLQLLFVAFLLTACLIEWARRAWRSARRVNAPPADSGSGPRGQD